MTTDSVNQVQDAPQDVQVKAGEADIARECQAIPSSLDDAHKVQEEKRKNYETNSSQSLPRVLVLDGEAGKKVVQIAEKVIDYFGGEEHTVTKVQRDSVPLGEVQEGDKDPRKIAPDEVQEGGDKDPRKIAPGDVQSASGDKTPGDIAFGEVMPIRAADVVAANEHVPAMKDLSGGDAPVRQGKTVVQQVQGKPGPDLQKDTEAIRKATERDDLIDTGTDEKAIFKAMEGKTPEQTLEMMKIYAKDNKGADLMQDLKEELSPEEYAKVKDQLQDAKTLEQLKGTKEVSESHEELAKRAKETMQEPALSKFLKDMDKFEGRAASLEREYERQGMKPEEAQKKAKEQIEKTYENMERLLAKNDGAPVSEKDRVLLAQQAMKHAADPKTISQGEYGTCGAESLQTRAYEKDPVEATRLIADVATKGEYTGNGKPPVTIKFDAESLKRHGQSAQDNPLPNERDYSSQLFDVAVYNIALEQKNRQTIPPGELKYEQHAGVAGAKPADNGTRLVDYAQADPQTGEYPRVLEKDPGLHPQDLAGAAKEISPSTSGDAVVIESPANGVARDTTRAFDLRVEAAKQGITIDKVDPKDPESLKKAHEAIDAKEGLDPDKAAELHRKVNEIQDDKDSVDDKSVVKVKSEQEMKDTLARLKEEGKLPVVVFVDMNNQPFWGDSGGGTAGGSGGGHFVTITDYDKETGMAKMQNQWGPESSHDISAKDIFESTRSPEERISTLQAEVDANRSDWFKEVDYGKEQELLRLKKQTGKISDDDYEKKIVELAVERQKKWKEDGGDLEDPKYKSESKMLGYMVAEIEKTDPARAQRIRDAVAKGTQA